MAPIELAKHKPRRHGPPLGTRQAHLSLHEHKKHKPAPTVKSDINVTPLVDVMLVLLIIFMVVTPMLTRGKDVSLPTAKFFLSQKDDGNQIIVSIQQDTSVYLGKDFVSLATLRERVGDVMRDSKGAKPVVIKADKRLPYGKVREVMEAVHDAGADNVLLATDEEKGS